MTSNCTLPGKRGAWHPPSFCVAGAALGDVHLLFAWQAALGDIHLRFALRTWHLWGWAGSGGALKAPWSRMRPRHSCLAGVALGHIHLRFAWQAWHLVTSTFVLRGRRRLMGLGWVWWRTWGPWSRATLRHFCVACVALGDTHLRFALRTWARDTAALLRGTW